MLIPSWFWMIYHLLFVVECRSLCCHGNSIEFIGPFIQNDFPDFISWWIMWLLLPSTKQFLKSFILQRAQTPRWLFSCFWNTNEFQMHLGTFPLHRVRGTKPPCISEPTGCIKSLCKQGKPVFLEGTVITVGRGNVVWKLLFYGRGPSVLPVFGPNYSFVPAPFSSGARMRKKNEVLYHSYWLDFMWQRAQTRFLHLHTIVRAG